MEWEDLSLFDPTPYLQLAVNDDERCTSVKVKQHAYSKSNPDRTALPSSWRCVLVKAHTGKHRARDEAHQSPWGD
jgi:hypothetical protein